MNLRKLADNLLKIIEATEPLVGLKNEPQAGKNLVGVLTNVFESMQFNFEEVDQEKLKEGLDQLKTKASGQQGK
jgi:hypothetical protein